MGEGKVIEKSDRKQAESKNTGSKIKSFTYLSQKFDGESYIYHIRIRYANEDTKQFRVKLDKGSVQIAMDDAEGKIALVRLLIAQGLIGINSLDTEINLGTLIIQDRELKIKEKLEKIVNEPSSTDNKIKSFSYISLESEADFDIYHIQIRYANNDTRQFRVKTNRGSVQITKNDTQGKKALIELLRGQGLISIDTPNVEIYLGTLIKQDGKLNIVAGKNYCCSDLHGEFELYVQAKYYLRPNDTLWVLGDAVDKGKNGIKILQDIIANSKSKAGIKINYILGNHDYMMLECIKGFEKLGVTGEEVIEYFKCITEYNELSRKNLDIPRQKTLERKIGMIENKWKKTEERDAIDEAIYNEAEKTLCDFYELSKEQQQEIRNFLENSPMMVTRQFGNKKVALVHSGPPINAEPEMGVWITYKDIKSNTELSKEMREQVIISIVWDSAYYFKEKTEPIEHRYNMWSKAGYKIIHGHTPTNSEEVESRSDGTISIDIDARNWKVLALYCIEDDEAIYITESGLRNKGRCKEIEIIKTEYKEI